MSNELINDAIVMGRVISTPHVNSHDGCIQFSIKTLKGTFFIKACEPESYQLCEGLEEGQAINVIGSLHSYVCHKCRSHHVYIKAKRLILVDNAPDFRNLITLLGAQTLTGLTG